MTSKSVTGIRIGKDGKLQKVSRKPRSVSEAIAMKKSTKVRVIKPGPAAQKHG